MKTTYYNRYGDNIIFNTVDENEIHMSGYNPEWLRIGYENDYSKAYDAYRHHCNELTEPDNLLLVEDVSANKLREMTLHEFKEALHSENPGNRNPFSEYRKLVHSTDKIHMVDPSGGPYIAKNTNLGLYFNDKKQRIVDTIEVQENKVIFKTK